MRIIVTFLVFFMTSQLFGEKPILKVFLSTNSCINCYSPLVLLNEVQDSVDICIVVNKGNELIVNEFVGRYNITRPYDVKVQYFEETLQISCTYEVIDKETVKFYLSDLDLYLERINTLAP